MKDRNTVQLIGYVGGDPEIKNAQNGSKRARIRIATHTLVKREDKGGQKQYTTTWHTVIAWAETATYAEGNFLKGSHILVDRRIRYGSYEDKHGEKKAFVEIVALNLINLDR